MIDHDRPSGETQPTGPKDHEQRTDGADTLGHASSIPWVSYGQEPEKRTRRPRRLVIVAVVAAVLVAVVSMILRGGDRVDGETADRIIADISQALQDSAIPEADAICVATHLVDAMGTEDLRKIEDFTQPTPEGLSEDFDAEFTVAQTAAIEACGISLTAPPGP